MKAIIHASILIMLLAGMACISPSSLAACTEVYYSPDDFYYRHPLRHPDAEFAKSYTLAQAGNALEQRNVAVSYDAGYLVSACPEKAHYWYQKAANNGDLIAQDWIARYNRFQVMFAGPEFAIRNEPHPVLASAPAAKARISTGGNRQQTAPKTDPNSLMERYAKYEQQLKDPNSDYGKLVHIGQALEGVLSK